MKIYVYILLIGLIIGSIIGKRYTEFYYNEKEILAYEEGYKTAIECRNILSSKSCEILLEKTRK